MSAMAFELSSTIDAFNGTLEFRWGPHEDEPLIMAERIDLAGQNIHDPFPALAASREIIVEDMQDRFDRGVDLDGNPWVGYRQRYKKWKDTHAPGQKKMHLTYTNPSGTKSRNDDLVKAVTNRWSYKIIGSEIFVDTSSWPPYWHALDVGSTVGRGVKLRARPFMGISENAQFAILDIFDDWVSRSFDIVIGTATGVPVFRPRRGGKGRFAGGFSMNRPRNIPATMSATTMGQGFTRKIFGG